jgi:hypothetical protein
MQKAATLAGGGLNLKMLLLDLVYAIAGLGLGGLDLETVLLGGGREKSPDRMFLPIRGFHDLGEAGSLGPADQRQDFRIDEEPSACVLYSNLARFRC